MSTRRDPRASAVVLLSGGLDSAVTAAVARSQGYRLYALSFKYGQRHGVELECAAKVAGNLGATRHLVLDIGLGSLGGSALTDDIEVPKDQPEPAADGIPVTYVPARNTIFLSYALAWAEVLEAADIFIGVNALDYSGYPDCRPEYLAAFNTMANLATKRAVSGSAITIHAPLIDMTKAQIVSLGLDLAVDFSLTSSCYDPSPDGIACGRCDSCRLRLKGFAGAGVPDPVPYGERGAGGGAEPE